MVRRLHFGRGMRENSFVGQMSFFGRAETAAMRDRTLSRNYSAARDEFRREHERHRSWGLRQRHAEKLRRIRAAAAGDTRAPAVSTSQPGIESAAGRARHTPSPPGPSVPAAQPPGPSVPAAQPPGPSGPAGQPQAPSGRAPRPSKPGRRPPAAHRGVAMPMRCGRHAAAVRGLRLSGPNPPGARPVPAGFFLNSSGHCRISVEATLDEAGRVQVRCGRHAMAGHSNNEISSLFAEGEKMACRDRGPPRFRACCC
jgi:hypothetical protein